MLMLKIQFGVAKLNKYASRESGDTLEIVERPTGVGGFTAVLVDGQGSGRSAKSLSNFVAGHCLTLLKQGVRDGVVARAANQQLYNHKNGQVSATLNLLTVDFTTQTLVITRNNPEPVYLFGLPQDQPPPAEPAIIPAATASLLALNETAVPLGLYPRTRPVIQEFPLTPGLVAVAFSDGLSGAGDRYGEKVDLVAFLHQRLVRPPYAAQPLADELLELALVADHRRPQDDMCVVVLTTEPLEAEDGAPIPRRMAVEFNLA